MHIKPYPDILKSANWQREKSVLAKLLPGKNTGIGEAMDDCQKSYARYTQAIAPVNTPAQLTPQIKAVAADFGLKMLHLKNSARNAANQWTAKTCPVPKTTRIYAENVAKTADEFHKSIQALLQ
jgi:hypothetical protein